MENDIERGNTPQAKRPYQKPQIEDYGTVVDLTGTGAGTLDDGAGGFARSGGAA